MSTSIKMFVIAFFIFCFDNSHCDLFSRKYAGGKTISDCLNGNRNPSNKLQKTTDETIKDNGYKVEIHLVLSPDGYLLPLYRLSGAKNATAVLLMHGLSLNSWYWAPTAFFLADNGYDVWIGNFRGSMYARCHTKYTDTDSRYWNFSYHEMAVYDLPAIVNYIFNFKQDTIHYIGHSMGTTVFFIFAIEKPDTANKIRVSHNFGPTAYLRHVSGLAVPAILTSPLWGPIVQFTTRGNVLRYTENNFFRAVIYDAICGTPILQNACAFLLFGVAGFDWPQLNMTKLSEYLNHFPSGISVKSVYHYAQVKFSGEFQYYDYGKKQNLILYNSTKPPNYDLSKISVPMALYKGANDFYCSLKDVDYLVNQLKYVVMDHLIEDQLFNHLDYVTAIDAPKYVYQPMLSVMKRFE